MKYIKISMLLFLALVLFPAVLNSQNVLKVEAVVLDRDNVPISNAIITNNINDVQGVTDEMGNFTYDVPFGSSLSIEAPGYKVKHIVANANVKQIYLNKKEIVHVALKTVDVEDVSGDVSYVNIPELLDKNFHTYSLDNLQSYISGYNGNVWGNASYLVIVDGVPRDAANVLPSEIEQITVLKGVSALALYGSKAARGAIVITTKRGTSASNQIKVRANTGINVPKLYPNYLGSSEYMKLYNEALSNDNLAPLYDASTPEKDIDNYASGRNPYRYPDIDYYSPEYLRKFTNSSNATAEFIGGTQKARFYTNMGISHDNSLLNIGEGKNDATTRINIRGNLDININSFITSRVNATMVFYDAKSAQGNYWGNAATLRPNRYVPLIPVSALKEQLPGDQELIDDVLSTSSFLIDDKYLLGGNDVQMTNPFAEMYTKGSNTYSSRNFQFDAAIDFNLHALLKGLSFHTQFGVDYLTSYNLSVNNNTYAVYEPFWWEDVDGNEFIYKLNKINEDKVSRGRSLSNSYLRQNLFFSSDFQYNNSFEGGHNVSAIFNARGTQETVSATYHKTASANLGLQASYNYQHKYYVDFTGNLLHSAKFSPKSRKAFSPTLSLGWRIGKEDFFKESNILNDLKINASAGILNTDLDFSNYYMYTEVFTTGGWNSWQEGRGRALTYMTRGGNEELTFVQRKEINAGINAALFNNKILLASSYFLSVMDGLPILSSTEFPSYFTYGYNATDMTGTNLIPYTNYNADLRSGVDFSLTYNQRIDKVDLSLGINGLYYTTKALKRSETYEYENQKREGRPIDAMYGMQSLGLYKDEQDIANHNMDHALGSVKPGDIKYIDTTGDGIIDGKDAVYLGRWSAPFTFGANLTLKWKNFTLFTLFNGNFGGYAMKNNSYYWVYGDRKYSEVVRDRAMLDTDPQTNELYVTNFETATYPRLTTSSSDNNFRDSDFWIYKTDRINLNRVQLTYDFSKHLFNDSGINGIGVYVSASDLLVIAKEKQLMQMNIGSSPQNRFFNVGCKVLF